MTPEKPQIIWTDEYRVRSYDADRNLKMKFTSLCRFMQDTAYNHAENLGVGFELLHDKNLIWMLSGQMVRIERYPHWKDTVFLRTWPSGRDRIFFYRDYKLTNLNGETVAIATTKWFIIDMNRWRPVRKGGITGMNFDYGEKLFPEGFLKIEIPDIESITCTLEAKFSDIDIYRHVNSARYIEWVFDSMPAEFSNSHELREIQVAYLSEALQSNMLLLSTFADTENAFIHTIKRLEDDKDICTMRSKWNRSADNKF